MTGKHRWGWRAVQADGDVAMADAKQPPPDSGAWLRSRAVPPRATRHNLPEHRRHARPVPRAARRDAALDAGARPCLPGPLAPPKARSRVPPSGHSWPQPQALVHMEACVVGRGTCAARMSRRARRARRRWRTGWTGRRGRWSGAWCQPPLWSPRPRPRRAATSTLWPRSGACWTRSSGARARARRGARAGGGQGRPGAEARGPESAGAVQQGAPGRAGPDRQLAAALRLLALARVCI